MRWFVATSHRCIREILLAFDGTMIKLSRYEKLTSLTLTGVILSVSIILYHLAPVPKSNLRATAVSDRQRAQIAGTYGKLPIRFEANEGQTDAEVKFIARGSGYNLFLTPAEAVMTLRKEAPRTRRTSKTASDASAETAIVRMRLARSNPSPEMSHGEELPGITNYFIGNDAAAWRTRIKSYGRIRYAGVYPGIDLVYHGDQRQLEYDFEVAPGSDPDRIGMSFDGADSLGIDAAGELILHTSTGDIVQRPPVAYQLNGAERREVVTRYVITPQKIVRFDLGNYDRAKKLVIDPIVLAYSTYLGGSGGDQGNGIAVDSTGAAYVTGYTYSQDFPTTDPTRPANRGFASGNSLVFVTKLNSSGSALTYSTYLGGSGGDSGNGIAVDSTGAAYVTGYTFSANFPVVNALQSSNPGANSGNSDAFVAKLNSSGSALTYSTYLGGSGFDVGNGIAVDSTGAVYVTGYAFSTNFPVVNAFQSSKAGGNSGNSNAFVAKLAPSGRALIYSTYLGGSGFDSGNGIAVDFTGAVYVTGDTYSIDFPVTNNAFQRLNAGANSGSSNVFVTKLVPSGSALTYSTYLGGSSSDIGWAIAVDSSGAAYVTGDTQSENFPIVNAIQSSLGGPNATNAFVTKFNPSGSALTYSTYLGGSSGDVGWGIAVDAGGAAYVTGDAYSRDFPVTDNAFQISNPDNVGNSSGFVAKLNSSGSALTYSTYLGGSGGNVIGTTGDAGNAIAVDFTGAAYVTGATFSVNFPVSNNAFQTYLASAGGNAFVTKIRLSAPFAAVTHQYHDLRY